MKPSAIIDARLRSNRHDWTCGVYTEFFTVDGAEVACHCQAKILSEYADTHGIPRQDEPIPLHLCRAYDLTLEQVDEAVALNDSVLDDARLDELTALAEPGTYAFVQSLAPFALLRVKEYYESIGK